MKRVLSKIFLGLGVLSIALPLFFLWWRSDFDRYLWMINQPYPLSDMGSGPFVGGLFILCILAAAIAFVLSWLFWFLAKKKQPPTP